MQKAARQTKPQATPKKAPRQKRPVLPLERKAYRIEEFCDVHRLSRSKYFELRKEGFGPRETRFEDSRTVIITEEAAAEWRAKRSAS